MVTRNDLLKRHAVYAATVSLVITIAKYTWALTSILLGMLLGVRWLHSTPIYFTLGVCFTLPAVTSLCVNMSAHTWWYAFPLDGLAVPPWLFPLHGILAHWVLDAHYMVTLRDLRKSALPGASH